jgi:hypothetical protein
VCLGLEDYASLNFLSTVKWKQPLLVFSSLVLLQAFNNGERVVDAYVCCYNSEKRVFFFVNARFFFLGQCAFVRMYHWPWPSNHLP